ncbi:HEAT repeat domain-containing protein, partial [Kitasatospora sp. NPDC054939]
ADACADVRLAVARRVGVRSEELDALTGDPDPRVRRVLSVLGRSGGSDLTDPDEKVRRTAVQRLGRPELAEALPALVRDADPVVRELVAVRWRNHDPELLALLAEDTDVRVRAAVAGNWYTPVEQLTELAADPDPLVMDALLGNRLAPPAALARIVDALARAAAAEAEQAASGAATEQLPEWELQEVRDARRHLVYEALRHPATPPESLRRAYELELDPYFHLGNAMSQPNWPADLLIDFGLRYCESTVRGDEEWASFHRIEEEVGTLPPEQVLATLLDSPIYYLRAAAANRHAPPEALAGFVRTVDPDVDNYHLDKLAKNPAVPQDVLLAWAAECNRCGYMLQNPELPEAVLAAIAECSNDDHATEARDLLEVRSLRAAAGRETKPC